MQVDKPRDAEGVWKDLKECILSEATSVCGETKGISRHKETWWWNDEVAALDPWCRKRSAYLDCARKDAGV